MPHVVWIQNLPASKLGKCNLATYHEAYWFVMVVHSECFLSRLGLFHIIKYDWLHTSRSSVVFTIEI